MIVSYSEFKGRLEIKTMIPGVTSEILFTGLDRRAGEEVPQKIGSNEFSDIFLDEGSETDQGDWDMLVTRLNWVPELKRKPEQWESIIDKRFHDAVRRRAQGDVVPWLKKLYGTFTNQMYTATNPEGPHHYLHKFFIDPKNHDKQDRHYELITPYDNADNLPPGYIESLEETLVGVNRDRLLLGKWVAAEGMIWSDFNKEVHVTEDLPPIGDHEQIYFGADSNYPKPRACVIGAFNGEEWYIYDEFYRRRAHAEDLGEWLAKKAEEWDKDLSGFHDPANPPVIDKLNTFPRVFADKADNSVLDGISAVAKHFTHGTIKIHPRCVGLLQEILTYRWKKDFEGEKPDKNQNDHACDALRYLIQSVSGGGFGEVFLLSDPDGIVL